MTEEELADIVQEACTIIEKEGYKPDPYPYKEIKIEQVHDIIEANNIMWFNVLLLLINKGVKNELHKL